MKRETLTSQGSINDITYFDALINEGDSDSYAFYFRGLARLSKGDLEGAISDMDEIAESDLTADAWDEVQLDRDYARFKAGLVGNTFHVPEKQLRENPLNALANTYYGEYITLGGQPELGLTYLERASLLDPNIGLAYLLRAQILTSRGDGLRAKEILRSSNGLNLPTYRHYVERASLYAQFGDFDQAFSDLRQAYVIQPNENELFIEQAQIYSDWSGDHALLADFMALAN